jgi:hypothetical protein
MSRYGLLVVLGFASVVAACASSSADIEWMKVNQPYTAAEFRRDYRECDKTDKLEDCLRSRGWVSVTAPNVKKQEAAPMYRPPGSATGGGRTY